MSELLKISLLRLKTHSSVLKGISKHDKLEQLPMSPILLDSLNIDNDLKKAYLSQRTALLSKKNSMTPVDSRLRPYQTQDVNFLLSLKNKANFNQQRVGKTPETLVTMAKLNEIENSIIIAPGSTTYSWKEDFIKWTGSDKVVVITSKITKKNRSKIYKEFKGTIIITYGLVLNDLGLLLQRNIDTIVLDEAHRIRNYRSMQSSNSPRTAKAIIQLSRKAKTRYALSGTPAPNVQHNIYGILAFLFPTLFKSYWAFIEYYFKVEDKQINYTDTVKKIGPFKSKQKEMELTQFLETISIQRKRKDVMQWIKEITPQKITLEAPKKLKKYYEELFKYFEIAEFDVVAMNTLDKMTKERQIAVDPELLGINIKSVKTEYIKEYMSDYPEKSLIIASQFTSYLKRLKEELPSAELLIGGVPDQKRHEIETKFNSKKSKVILGNIDIMKEGMKLYGADTMIMVDRSLTYTDNEQVMDRLIPITEAIAKDIEVQDIIILNTDLYIEQYLDEQLSNKKTETDIINNYASALKVRPSQK